MPMLNVNTSSTPGLRDAICSVEISVILSVALKNFKVAEFTGVYRFSNTPGLEPRAGHPIAPYKAAGTATPTLLRRAVAAATGKRTSLQRRNYNMAYIEHDQLDAQLKKLENVCAENGFTYKFLRDKYPSASS